MAEVHPARAPTPSTSRRTPASAARRTTTGRWRSPTEETDAWNSPPSGSSSSPSSGSATSSSRASTSASACCCRCWRSDDTERRVMINTIGPVWDGNEVWLLVAGGATFAAFPEWYATLFSGFYLPLLLILVALIVRGVAFEYRAKRDDGALARAAGTWPSIVGSFVPGAAVGRRVRQHRARRADRRRQGVHRHALHPAQPVRLLGGLVTLLLFLTHGAMFVALKTDGEIRHRARGAGGAARRWSPPWSRWSSWSGRRSTPGALGSAVLFVLAAARAGRRPGRGRAAAARAGPSSAPSSTHRARRGRAVRRAVPRRDAVHARPRRTRLTTTNASATPYTLKIMTWVAVVFTPLVLLYQGWTYWVFRRRIGTHHIPDRPSRAPADEAARPAACSPHLRAGPRAAGRACSAPASVGGPAGRRAGLRGRRPGRRRGSTGGDGSGAGRAVVAGGARRPAPVRLDVVDVAAARAAGAVATDLRRRVLAAILGGRAAGRAAPADRRARAAGHPRRRRGRAVPHPLPAGPGAGRRAAAAHRASRSPAQDLLSAADRARSRCRWCRSSRVLVGLATRDRARAPVAARCPSLVRALPRRGARPADAGRATAGPRAQSATIRAVTDRYRRATLDTLRLAFASSAVLELVATLSVALVAVTRRPPAGRRRPRPAHRAGRAAARARGVLAAAPGRRGVPRRRRGRRRPSSRRRRCSTTAPAPDRPALPASGPRPVTVRGLTVTWPDRAAPALERIDADFPAPGLTAVTGPSGCGKSTLLATLLGELSRGNGAVRDGSIRVGDDDLLTADPASWQRQVAWLPQRPWLVAGSLADNVRLGRPGRGRRRRVGGARAGRDRRAGRQPRPTGSTRCSARTGRLSAGQRARLAWPGCCSRTARACCSTSPPRTSTPRPRPCCSTRSGGWRGGPPSSWSRTATALVAAADHVVRLPAPAAGPGSRAHGRPDPRPDGAPTSRPRRSRTRRRAGACGPGSCSARSRPPPGSR